MARNRDSVLSEISSERSRQDTLWGDQSGLDYGTLRVGDTARMEFLQNAADRLQERGSITFRDILAEEVAEAFCAENSDELRKELVQVAAVCVQWIEAIDKRVDKRTKTE